MIRLFSDNARSFSRLPCLVLFLTILLCPLTNLHCPPALAEEPYKALADILSSAESQFKAMQAKNYTAVWAGLSAESRSTIVEETRKEIARTTGGKTASREEIQRDFEEGGPIARGYWIGFLTHFDPGLVLEQSRWEMGKIEGDRAEILITYRTAEKPALLKLFREGGGWKVGLVETFWGRK